MGYQVYKDIWHPGRWAGYGVPAICDMPGCEKKIDRGLGYQCEYHEEYDAHQDDYVKHEGCYLYFCSDHQYDLEFHALAEPKPDIPRWLWWILSAESWGGWRAEHPETVIEYNRIVEESGWRPSQEDYSELFFDKEDS